MPIDFGSLARPRPRKRPIEPLELFGSLRVTDAAVNDLWHAQGTALGEWHRERAKRDAAIVLNTGAGKTLVGLLAAQSLANETDGHVLYACSTLNLVDQTAEKAHGYGLDVTTYMRGTFSDDLYRQGQAPCITTYQALFNGRSRFFADRPTAIIFDDAHTAEHLLRDQFTLRIRRERHEALFHAIVALYRSYHIRTGQDMGYMETQQADASSASWFVPPFAVREGLGELQRLLAAAGLGEDTDTLFAWAYLRDHIEQCALFISSRAVTLTPPYLPTASLPYFGADTRRVYLSATLTARDGFLRTFGREPAVIIAPRTSAGECERLILLPGTRGRQEADMDTAKAIIAREKALILTPTHRRAEAWEDVAVHDREGEVTEQLAAFKVAAPPAALALAGRYDGVDLPGDTCRILVIDELPSGVGPLERYLWERLGLTKSLRSTIASRVVQSFGRISRGMSDHGVVVLTGEALLRWLLTPWNRAALPPFLQQQLEIGILLSGQADTPGDFVRVARQCLDRDPGWLDYYRESMEGLPGAPVTDEDALTLSSIEVRFGQLFWEREYAEAARHLERSLDGVFAISRNTAAWLTLWLGYCYELLGEGESARERYHRAHRTLRAVPPFPTDAGGIHDDTVPAQVSAVAATLRLAGGRREAFLAHFDRSLLPFDGTASPAATEEALRALGEYLGLDASRPDHEHRTGPDVLWTTPGEAALSLEVKTDKQATSVYKKEELGQLRDHTRWVSEHTDAAAIIPAFVGPRIPASDSANPDPEMVVIELAAFRELADRLRATLVDIMAQALQHEFEDVVSREFGARRLIWPSLYEQLRARPLRDLAR